MLSSMQTVKGEWVVCCILSTLHVIYYSSVLPLSFSMSIPYFLFIPHLSISSYPSISISNIFFSS